MDLRSLLLSRDEDTVRVLSRLLADLGIGMEHCVDANSALESLARRKYDGVFADCNVDGAADLLKNMRLSRANKRSISFAILSQEMSVRSAFQMGANFVFYKPLTSARAKRSLKAAHGLMMRERRRHFRHPMDARVALRFENAREQQATILDLSTGGMALKAPEPLAMMNRVHVRFALPGSGRPIEAAAEVTWVDSHGRAGVHFVEVADDGQERLEDWLLARSQVGDEQRGEASPEALRARPRNAAGGAVEVELVESEESEPRRRAESRARGIFRGSAKGRLTVVLIRSGKVMVIHGHCEDLSEEGLGGTMDGELLMGDKVLIELALSEFEEPLRLHGEVRHRSGSYYGFALLALDALQRKAIKRISEELPVR